jgi:hypothetical protein
LILTTATFFIIAVPLFLTPVLLYLQQNASASSDSRFTVSIEGREYELQYSLTGASLIGMQAEPDTKTLRISIDAVDDGILTIELPKSVMDSSQNGVDTPFIVSISEQGNHDGGKTVQIAEIYPPRDSRIVEVAFPKGTSEIQIVGTYLVPEFSYSSASLIIMASIAAIIMVFRTMLVVTPAKRSFGFD